MIKILKELLEKLETEKDDIVFEEAVEKGETAIKVNQLKQQLLKLNLIY